MRRKVGAALPATVLGLALACAPQPADDATAAAEGTTEGQQLVHNRLTQEERAEGWRLLFDGETTAGWRGYGRDDMLAGWQAIDGELRRVSEGGDIITVDRFRNFDLEVEWKVGPGGNSGIFYRAIEGDGPIYMYAPEMQILDDARHPDGESEITSAGSNYELYPAPRGVVRPAGEWNGTRIRIENDRVTYWLNGRQIVQYELGGPDWEQRVASSKFAEWPSFGRADEGHIGLQDHGDPVAFRNMKIRELPDHP